MLRGFCGLGLVGVCAVAALVGPSVALACDHSGSAVSIYSDCPTNAGGKAPKHSHKGTPSGNTQPTYVQPAPPVPVSHVTKRALAHSGKDKKVLKNLVSNPNLVESRRLNAEPTAAAIGATSLGSTFDLGSGPTILFALLIGTVLLLLGSGGVRTWRNRHRA